MRRADPEALFAEAQRLISAYRREEAETVLRRTLRALSRSPSRTDGAGRLRPERVELSLAAVRAELGTLAEGIAMLADIEARIGPADPLAGAVHAQRGLVLWRAGRASEALPWFESAERSRTLGVTERYAVHLSRGALQLTLGKIDPARRDYDRSVAIALGSGDQLHLTKALMSLAYVDYVRGDIPAALAGLDRVLSGGLEEPGVVAETRLMRADALLAAGLLAEAEGELRQAVSGFAGLRMLQDRAESEALQAQVALADDRPADAVRLARLARRRFERRGSGVWALVAELVELQARVAGPRLAPARARVVGDRAAQLADGLRAAGLADDACVAALVAARAYLAAGRRSDAGRWARHGTRRHAGIRLTTRLEAAAVRSALAADAGERRRADAYLRAGLRTLHRYQASFGSLEAQTAVVRHGRELVRAGLAAALQAGRPDRVLAWAEEARALASRLPPVRPPDDPAAAELLQELRLIGMQLRQARLAGQRDPDLDARRAALEEQVRRRSWHATGPGDVEGPVRIAEVRSALSQRAAAAGHAGGALAAHLIVAGEVHAVVVTPRRARLVRLGPAGPVMEALRRAGADLDTLAVQSGPHHLPRMRELVMRSLTRALGTLDDLLWRPLADAAGDGPLVLVPAGALVAVPWSALPGLRGRPVTVARSATSWTRRPAGERLVPGCRVVAASGPDLERAEDEVREVGAMWPGATVFTGAAARGVDVALAASGAAVVHVAAHGHHEPASPLFSALRMADGPLFGYDLGRLGSPPAQVVLSACDLGRAAPRPGDEVLGMAAALLHAGTPVVVASVARVADDVAHEVVVGYHRRLRAGADASTALAASLGDRIDAPFLCFGAGW